VARLIRAGRRGEIEGQSSSRHVGIPRCIHGDSKNRVILCATQISGVEKRRTGRVQLGDESIAEGMSSLLGASAVSPLESAIRDGKIWGLGHSGHVRIP